MTYKNKQNPVFIHLGGMRTASTFLQNIFKADKRVNLLLKSRFFSFDTYYEKNVNPHISVINQNGIINIDSDENYSLGRFKTKLLKYEDPNFNLKSELNVVYHDVNKMANRIYKTYPNAKIFMLIREQRDWLKSVYRHDVQHYALDLNFHDFLNSRLGKSYLEAGDYQKTFDIYTKLFGEKNVRFFLFEDFKKDQLQFIKNLYNLLGLKYVLPEPIDNITNKTYSDNVIYILRHINKISQRNLGSRENRIYYYLRWFLYRTIFIIDYFDFLGKNLFKQGELDNIRQLFQVSNKKLAVRSFSAEQLAKYKYISR